MLGDRGRGGGGGGCGRWRCESGGDGDGMARSRTMFGLPAATSEAREATLLTASPATVNMTCAGQAGYPGGRRGQYVPYRNPTPVEAQRGSGESGDEGARGGCPR